MRLYKPLLLIILSLFIAGPVAGESSSDKSKEPRNGSGLIFIFFVHIWTYLLHQHALFSVSR